MATTKNQISGSGRLACLGATVENNANAVPSVTLHRTASKSGKYYTFSIPGVRGQLHIAPKMVQGSCPATIEVVGVEFAAPGADDSAKAQAQAEKASKALAKAQERVAKAQAKLTAIGVPAATGETPASDVPTGDDASAVPPVDEPAQ